MTQKEDPAFVERFTVRMPDGMRDAVATRAKANGRSMNAEIVQILEDALKGSEWNLDSTDTNEMKTIIRMQEKLLADYADALERGSEIFKLIAESNKKPT